MDYQKQEESLNRIDKSILRIKEIFVDLKTEYENTKDISEDLSKLTGLQNCKYVERMLDRGKKASKLIDEIEMKLEELYLRSKCRMEMLEMLNEIVKPFIQIGSFIYVFYRIFSNDRELDMIDLFMFYMAFLSD